MSTTLRRPPSKAQAESRRWPSARIRWLLAAMVVAAAVVAAFIWQGRGGDALPAGTSTNEASTGEGTQHVPAEPPSPGLRPQPDPFAMELSAVRLEASGNGPLFGRPARARQSDARAAARAATEQLRHYLDAAFVTRETRFTRQPLGGLLTRPARDALTPRDLRALGVDALRIEGGGPSRAEVDATVLADGSRVQAVTLDYTATVKLYSGGSLQPLTQRGSMLFLPQGDGWKADMVDVRLALPPAAAAERDQ